LATRRIPSLPAKCGIRTFASRPKKPVFAPSAAARGAVARPPPQPDASKLVGASAPGMTPPPSLEDVDFDKAWDSRTGQIVPSELNAARVPSSIDEATEILKREQDELAKTLKPAPGLFQDIDNDPSKTRIPVAAVDVPLHEVLRARTGWTWKLSPEEAYGDKAPKKMQLQPYSMTPEEDRHRLRDPRLMKEHLWVPGAIAAVLLMSYAVVQLRDSSDSDASPWASWLPARALQRKALKADLQQAEEMNEVSKLSQLQRKLRQIATGQKEQQSGGGSETTTANGSS